MRKPEGYQTPFGCQRPKDQFVRFCRPIFFRDYADRRFDLALNKQDKFWYSRGLDSPRNLAAKENFS